MYYVSGLITPINEFTHGIKKKRSERFFFIPCVFASGLCLKPNLGRFYL